MGIVELVLKTGATMPLLVSASDTPTSIHPRRNWPLSTTVTTADTLAGVLTKEFLDFSASRGNNLRSIGLEPGCKWCLCTARWKEAMEAAKGPNDPVVPKCVLPEISLFGEYG